MVDLICRQQTDGARQTASKGNRGAGNVSAVGIEGGCGVMELTFSFSTTSPEVATINTAMLAVFSSLDAHMLRQELERRRGLAVDRCQELENREKEPVRSSSSGGVNDGDGITERNVGCVDAPAARLRANFRQQRRFSVWEAPLAALWFILQRGFSFFFDESVSLPMVHAATLFVAFPLADMLVQITTLAAIEVTKFHTATEDPFDTFCFRGYDQVGMPEATRGSVSKVTQRCSALVLIPKELSEYMRFPHGGVAAGFCRISLHADHCRQRLFSGV